MTAPFRFGLVGLPRDRETWQQQARRAESLGFDSLLVPDTLDGVAPMVACAAAAAVTDRLTVGPYVMATPLTVPGLVAADAAALDVVAGGRVEIGLGAGRPGVERDADRLGVELGSPGRRVQVLEATIAAVRSRTPHATVLVAGAGPRLLELAGRTADVVALGAPPQADEVEVTRLGRAVLDAAESAGRTGQVVLNTNLTAVGDEVPPWLAQRMGITMASLVEAGSAGILTGSPDQMVQTLLGRRDRTGVSYVCASVDHADALAPVVERLSGR